MQENGRTAAKFNRPDSAVDYNEIYCRLSAHIQRESLNSINENATKQSTSRLNTALYCHMAYISLLQLAEKVEQW